MKLKLLLLLISISSALFAQDTIRSLVITEAFVGRPYNNHVELTNMGEEPIQLNDFVFGRTNQNNYQRGRNAIQLPDYILQPGESYFITDFTEWMVDIPEDGWDDNPRYTMGMPMEWAELADLKNHKVENTYGQSLSELDSVSPVDFLYSFWGRNAFFIEQQLSDTTAVVIDQVGGVWDNDNGNGRQRPLGYATSYSVAGFQNATSQARLIRKFSVKTGNLDFANARGVGVDDSEWMAIPYLASPNRVQPWTLKNHGDFNLDANTLIPTLDGLEVDFAGKSITVPWGLRKPDDIMANMEKKPGVAWYYHLNSNREDSLSFAVKTGDKLEVVVAGIDLDRDTFNILVSDPAVSDNIIIPRIRWEPLEEYKNAIRINFSEWPVVTRNESGMDTIRGYKTQHYENIPDPDYYYGLPFATRVDTLLKLLEKPDNATWEIVWVDGIRRADLKNGDKLKITAENGDIKEYYIYVDDYRPSSNTTLSAIQWPDIPEFYRGLFGWIGDTIPNFVPYSTNYIVELPQEVEGIPALAAKTENNNATVEVQRATDLFGSVEDKTVTFKVVAEDDNSFRFYKVQLEKEKLAENIEPYYAEPFISKMMVQDQFANDFVEVCNPGNQPLDLSNYMFAENNGNANPADAVSGVSETDDWMDRYRKYVPGYKWVGQAEWNVTPAILTQDLGVNSIVMPGDVFVMGNINRDVNLWRIDPNYNWTVPEKLDVQFRNTEGNLGNYTNPWGEEIGNEFFPGWHGACIFMFKILNDSIKRGLKPATDPNDFELIDAWGMPDGSKWWFSDPVTEAWGNANLSSWIRKPEFTKPNPVMGASFGAVGDSVCEWIRHDDDYWRDEIGIPNPLWQGIAPDELGNHFFVRPTEYLSTVGSSRYKVTQGYGPGQEITGIVSGTTVNEFLSYIIKYDENQTLTLLETVGGAKLGMDIILEQGNVLHVLSADSANTTEYALKVSETGLSSDAVLISERYNVVIEVEPKSATDDHNNGEGIVTGMEYGTLLSTVVNNLEVPEGATMTIIDGAGVYVPLKTLNFDTTYVGVTISTDIYFEVIAEDKITKIIYQIIPVVDEDYAFLTSNVYNINQKTFLISNVPAGEYASGEGMNVSSFLQGLAPSAGATMKVVDKFGLERNEGKIYQDDKVIVTSPSGNVNNVYHISFLRNAIVKSTTYLAYVLSKVDAYKVDQVNYVISGTTGATEVSDFMNRIEAAVGATAMVVDMEGNEKTTGDLDDGDMVKVVSADGTITVMYELDLDLTFSDFVDSGNINLYPNPTNGKINISGVEASGRIQVFNSTGSLICNLKVNETIETVSLSDQPAGMYLIMVSDANKLLGRYKVIRK